MSFVRSERYVVDYDYKTEEGGFFLQLGPVVKFGIEKSLLKQAFFNKRSDPGPALIFILRVLQSARGGKFLEEKPATDLCLTSVT